MRFFTLLSLFEVSLDLHSERDGILSNKFNALRKGGVFIDMVDNTNVKIEAQAVKKTKGAKATRTSNVSKISATMTRARRKFQQQLKKNQNLQTKIECIEEVAEEVYGSSSAQMVWHDLLKESKRLTNLVDFNEYCRSLGLEPSYVAQHIVFDGSGAVNKVMRNGVESIYGAMLLTYGEPLFNPLKFTGKTFSLPRMKVAHVAAEQLMTKGTAREEMAETEVMPTSIATNDAEEETAA